MVTQTNVLFSSIVSGLAIRMNVPLCLQFEQVGHADMMMLDLKMVMPSGHNVVFGDCRAGMAEIL